MLYNYFLIFKNFIFLPEIFLISCILLLVVFYNFFFKKTFGQIYFLWYSVICIIITIFLIAVTPESAYFYGIFLFNYKISTIQVTILLISLFCLILFHRSLTKSYTNCLKYLIFYLVTVLLCLLATMINTSYLLFLFLSLELITICFYILSSFNYHNYGFLIFRFIPVRKLLYVSALSNFTGLFLFKLHLFLVVANPNYFYLLHYVKKQEYLLIIGISLISIGLLLKTVIFYSPTSFIYYKKTPTVTIIYMHLVPKIFFFYFFSELVYLNPYFIYSEYYINLIVLCASLSCLIISIGMRRLFLKHFIEYLSLVNSGYLLLCLTPLTFNSLNYCIYFILFYVLTIFLYGGILLFFDDKQYPGLRISFDTILNDIDKKDYYSIIISILIFFFLGMPPTRRDYPCSRGIPFNGFIFQYLVFQSLLYGNMYLILFFLIIFNLIVFLFFFWTIIPFWYERKNNFFSLLPAYLNSPLKEFIPIYLIIFLLVLQLDSTVVTNFVKFFYK